MTLGATKFIGRRIARREDPRFLMGDTEFVDDIELPRMVHAAFVRSLHAHAIIRAVDVEPVRRHAACVGVITGRDIVDSVRPIHCDARFPEFKGPDWPVLAWPRTRFVGEAVAVVAAPSRYLAEDLAELIAVDYEPLVPLVDPERAAAVGTPPVHEGWKDNFFVDRTMVAGNVEAALRDAEYIFEGTYRMHRHTGFPLEGRACIADYSRATELLTLYSATQIPHLVRTGLADVLGMPENHIRVVASDVGGGFGIKGHLFPEEVAVAALAIRLGRPVKWVEDTREHLLSCIHARDHRHTVRIAFRRDGTILGVEADVLVDIGAYSVWPWSATLDVGQAGAMLIGPYAVRNYRARTRGVVTNKCPIGPYRGVGRPAAVFTIERALDDAARALSIDPIDLRLRNYIPDDAYPYEHVNGHVYDSASLVASLRKASEVLDYEGFRREQAAARKQGRYLGIGFAQYIEQTGHTHEFVKRGTPITFSYDSIRLSLDPSGTFTAQSSLHSHGQGHETAFAQILAERLGVPLEAVRVEFGDTASAPYGMGTFASRSAVLGGGASWKAADVIRGVLTRLAGHVLEASPDDLQVEDGVVRVKGLAERNVTIRELARFAFHHSERLPAGMTAGDFTTVQIYDAPPGTGAWTNSVNAAIVEVDVATGTFKILRYVIVEDCGNLINPLIVDGQIHGGVAQGIGGALFEHLRYDDNGQLLSQTLMEYLLPTAEEIPHLEVFHLTTPSPYTIGGFKGLGEGGAIAPMATLSNAVTDALAPLKVCIRDLPLTPDRILDLIESAYGSAVRR
jgi:aerobic carbon-monoxide dehydrogenase large subunit